MAQRNVVNLKPLENYHLWIQFADGVEGVVNLSDLAGKGVFTLWDDYREFQKAHIGPAGGVAWDDDIDMCPDALYLKVTGKQPDELFPVLRNVMAHA